MIGDVDKNSIGREVNVFCPETGVERCGVIIFVNEEEQKIIIEFDDESTITLMAQRH